MASPFPTLDAYLFRPVVEGLWTHREITSGTMSFGDLMDAHEILDVKARRQAEWQAYQKLMEDVHGG